MSFSNNLKIAMAEKQMTQSELAIAINKGKSSVSQYLSGRSVPRPEVQEKIAEVLECTVEFLNSENETEISNCNVSVAQAAKLLGKGEEFVRVSLQMGTAPFGFAAKTKTKWSYHISLKKLNEYIGG